MYFRSDTKHGIESRASEVLLELMLTLLLPHLPLFKVEVALNESQYVGQFTLQFFTCLLDLENLSTRGKKLNVVREAAAVVRRHL